MQFGLEGSKPVVLDRFQATKGSQHDMFSFSYAGRSTCDLG